MNKELAKYLHERMKTGDEVNTTFHLIKVPTEIYPTLYDTFVFLFKQAGVKNLQITKEVNFEKMYKERKK